MTDTTGLPKCPVGDCQYQGTDLVTHMAAEHDKASLMSALFAVAPPLRPEAQLSDMLAFADRITAVLNEATIPAARIVEDTDSDSGIRVEAPGYRITDSGRKFADIAILGRDGIVESSRQAERSGIMQAARHALVQAGFEVLVNKYGHLRAREVQ